MPSKELPRLAFLTCALLLSLGAAACAQDATSFRNVAFENPTGEGSRRLDSIVWYPSAKGRALAKPPAQGYSVLVFLHGRGGPAGSYTTLAKEFAERGYVVVLSDTARADPRLQRQDGRALYQALALANQTEGSFWKGAFDMNSVGLAGHSMGGGSMAHVLADNPGYKAGFAFAPWQGRVPFTECSRIKVPLGIIHGQGDRVLAWKNTGKRLFDALPSAAQPFLYLANREVNHINVALSFPFSNARDREIFKECLSLCVAFFEKHLHGEGEELERRLSTAGGDPRLVKIYQLEEGAPQAKPRGPRRYF